MDECTSLLHGLVATTFWFLWANGKKAKFRNQRTKHSSLVCKVLAYTKEYNRTQQMSEGTIWRRVVEERKQQGLLFDCILETDGSFLIANLHAGTGSILEERMEAQ